MTAHDIAMQMGHTHLLSILSAAALWRRRRVSVWLSSVHSSKRNILYNLPSDVARICALYM